MVIGLHRSVMRAVDGRGLVVINGRVQVRSADGHRIVTCRGAPFAHFDVGDRMAEAHAMVSLVEQGWAEQLEVAKAFGCSERSVRRYQRRFEDGGLAALGRPRGFPKGQRRTPASRSSRALRLKQEGLSTARWPAGYSPRSNPSNPRKLPRAGPRNFEWRALTPASVVPRRPHWHPSARAWI